MLTKSHTSQVPVSGGGDWEAVGSTLGTSATEGCTKGEKLHWFPHPLLPPCYLQLLMETDL